MSLGFESIVGHEKIGASLRAAIERGSIAHAYLFRGPAGVGKRRMAMALFAALQCERHRTVPCGQCASCRLLREGKHPDIRILEPEGKARIIRIDPVREVSRALAYPPIVGRYKCVLVDDADCFNEAAGNALLKTLEEPASQTVFVLVTARPHVMLPTILSRCQKVYFSALSRPVIASWLVTYRSIDEATATTVAGMAEGSLGRALEQLDESLLEHRQTWFAHLGKLRSMPPREVLLLAEEMGAKREALELALDLVRSYLRDVLVLASGAAPEVVINRDVLPLLQEHAAHSSPQRVLTWLEVVQEGTDSLRVNTAPRLVAERVLLSIAYH